jgi:hypothetical protein
MISLAEKIGCRRKSFSNQSAIQRAWGRNGLTANVRSLHVEESHSSYVWPAISKRKRAEGCIPNVAVKFR